MHMTLHDVDIAAGSTNFVCCGYELRDCIKVKLVLMTPH